MAERPDDGPPRTPRGLGDEVGPKEKRKLRARRGSDRTVWLGLGLFGVVGWTQLEVGGVAAGEELFEELFHSKAGLVFVALELLLLDDLILGDSPQDGHLLGVDLLGFVGEGLYQFSSGEVSNL